MALYVHVYTTIADVSALGDADRGVLPVTFCRMHPAGSHHFVCCEGITTAGNEHSPHGNRNPLARVIGRASDPETPSWCTCSEEVKPRCSCAACSHHLLTRSAPPTSLRCPLHSVWGSVVQICTEQLGGSVAWNMNGEGWKGFRPRNLHGAGGGDLPVE